MNWKGLLDYGLARLGENSTWRGLILIATSAGVYLDPDKSAAITSAGLAMVGLINVFRKAPVQPSVTPPTP